MLINSTGWCNETAAMSSKASSQRRYQPVAEFDDVTLARKREYWRSKKREQRAKKKSSTRTNIRNENLGLCKQAVSMSVVSNEHSSQIPNVSSDPSLYNSDVSCKLEDVNTAINLVSSGLLVSESNVNTVACQKESFQRNNPDHPLPQLSETSTICLKGNKKIVMSSVTLSSNMDATKVKQNESFYMTGHLVPPSNSTLPRKTGLSALHQLETPQQSLVVPSYNKFKPQIKKCLPLRPLTSVQCKFNEDQRFTESKSPMTRKKTCAFSSKHNPNGTIKTAMSEEERAAKRRENWRIKKREQRAKLAAKMALNREKSLGHGQALRTGIACSSFPVNNCKVLRGIIPKSISLNQGSLGKKVETQASVAINTTQHVRDTKPNHTCLFSGILQQSSSATQTVNKPKVRNSKFPHTQKRRFQKQMRKSLFGVSKVESAEDRHARQKEYWRIKKREQRARLSAAGTAQLKEPCEAPKPDVKRFHNSFNQIHEVQAGCQKAHQTTDNTFASASDTIGGFIIDDGTVSISKTSEASQAITQHFPNIKCIEKVKLEVQVSSPLYPNAPSVPKSGFQNKPASRNISSNFINAHQKSIGHNFSNTSQIKSKLARGAVMGRMTLTIQSERLTEEERVARMREYWRIKKREQRASRAARHGLLKSKILVLKQREQNHKSTKGYPSTVPSHSITPSVDTTVCDSSTSAPILTPGVKQEQICPSIQAVFSLSEMNSCNNVKENTPSHCPPNKTSADSDHNATTLQAVASMKKLLEESVSTMEESSATIMHIKCEDEPVAHETEYDVLRPEDTEPDVKPNVTLQQNFLLQCDISEDTNYKKDIKVSPALYHSPSRTLDSSSEDTINQKSHNLSKGDADDVSLVTAQPVCKDAKKLCDGKTGPEQCCPPPALQEQHLDKNNELQRKREYWRLMKRQQRARKAKARHGSKDAALQNLGSQPEQMRGSRCQINLPPVASQSFKCHTNVSSNDHFHTTGTEPSTLLMKPIISNQHPSMERQLQPVEAPQSMISQAPQVKPWQSQFSNTSPVNTRSSTSALQSVSWDAVTFRQNSMQKETKMCTKPAGLQMQPTGLFIGNWRSTRTPNPEDPEEMIHKRRMQWRIKKQEQRARKAARDRELQQQTMVNDWGPIAPQDTLHQGLASQGQNTTSVCSGAVMRKTEDQLDDIVEQCQTGLKVEAGPLSQAEWRHVFLMDSDPVNPLLVCMVCGEQQYSLSVDGVRAHIEEVHPHTLSLGEQERQDIIVAWDKQVAIRECFITNQLQQHSRAFTDLNSNCPVEIEVKIEAED